MTRKVLITTSGTGSRLGDLTQYTNKSLINIGGRAAIDHIIDSYKGASFVITLGYKGDLVKQYLSIAYPDLNIQYVEIDKYEGPGSSLLYSMSCASHLLQEPFIFHSCDTIVPGIVPTNLESNWVGVNNTNHGANSGNYRTVTVDSATDSIRINEKGLLGDFAYIGLIGVRDFAEFWKLVELRLMKPDLGLSDAHIVDEMVDLGYKFAPQEFIPWCDTGNLASLDDTRFSLQNGGPTILEKPGQSVYVRDTDVIKFFSEPDMVTDRVYRAEKLGKAVPSLLKNTTNFFSYEKVEGHTFTEEVQPKEFEEFLEWCWVTLWSNRSLEENLTQLGRKFYYEKTKNRLALYFDRVNSKDLPTVINGKQYGLVQTSLELMDKQHPEVYDGPYVHSFHGDLHNANIFSCSPHWRLIDWRENFAGQKEVGDIYYDLAKLNHGLIVSHDLVERNMYTVNELGHTVKIDIFRKDSLVRCQEVLKKFVGDVGLSWFKVELITALIFLNIAPLHHSHYDKYLFYLGKSMLGDLVE